MSDFKMPFMTKGELVMVLVGLVVATIVWYPYVKMIVSWFSD